MERQEMNVAVLSQEELSKLNDEMNQRSKLWVTLARLAEEDVDMWDLLTLNVIQRLSAQLSKTSNRDLFSLIPGLPEAERFAENLKDDELKDWKEGVLMGVRNRSWEQLAMHRTSLPLAVYHY
jgi:hypothetical protein